MHSILSNTLQQGLVLEIVQKSQISLQVQWCSKFKKTGIKYVGFSVRVVNDGLGFILFFFSFIVLYFI